jgi:hypothetical protein
MIRKAASASGRAAIVSGGGVWLLALALGGCGGGMDNAEAQARRELTRTQRGWTPVTASSLAPEDFDKWEAERAGQDPGFIEGDFFGDGRPAFAGLVRQESEGGKRARLVILGQEPSGRFVSYPVYTESAIQRTPMIWKSEPDEYEVYLREEMVRIPVAGVVYSHPGVGQKLFFWRNNGFVDVELGS